MQLFLGLYIIALVLFKFIGHIELSFWTNLTLVLLFWAHVYSL